MDEEKDKKGFGKETDEKVKKKNIFRKILRVLLAIILGFVGLNVLLYILLSIPWIQQKAVDFAINQLKPIVKTEMSIGEVRLSLFNNVSLKDIYIEDQLRDTLLFAEELDVKLSLWELLKSNTLMINSISLSNAAINVSQKTPDAPFNFQFFIDAFAGDSTETDTTSSSLKINIQDIRIKNARLRYDILSEPDTLGLFNASHIHISNLNADLRLPSLDMKNFEGEIKSLSFNEKSGLKVNQLAGNVFSEGDNFYTKGLLLQLPRSELKIESASYNLETSEFSLKTAGVNIEPKDLTMFMSELRFLRQPLAMDASVSGKLPEVKMENLTLNYGETTSLKAKAEITNYSKIDSTYLNLSIDKLYVAQKDLPDFMKVGDSTMIMPEPLALLGDIKINGGAGGYLNALKLNLEASTKQGSLVLSGTGSTDTTFQNFSADAILHTQNFNLRPFVGDSLGLGRISLDISVQAKQSAKQSLSVQAKGLVNSLEYKDEMFRKVPFTAYYSAYKMGGWIDADLPIGYVKGDFEMIDGKETKYIADLVVKNFRVSEFYKAENWDDPLISFNLTGNLQGQDINTLLGDIVLDSLKFVDTGFDFEPGTITLQAGTNNRGRYVALRSSLCDANLSGEYNFVNVYDDFSEIMHPFLPKMFSLPKKKKAKTNNFRIDAFIDNTQTLANIFDLPLVLNDPLQFHTSVNATNNTLLVNVNAPHFTYGDMDFKSTNVELRGDSLLKLEADTRYMMDQSYFDGNLKIDASSDTLDVLLTVKNGGMDTPLTGQINALAYFEQDARNALISNIRLLPTKLNIGKLEFAVLPATIKQENERIDIRDFGLSLKDRRFFGVDGVISDEKDETLNIFFDKAEVGSFLEAFDVKNVNAVIDGSVLLNAVTGDMAMTTKDFSVSDIIVFNDTLGTLSVNSEWSNLRNTVDLDLGLVNSAKGTNTTIKGSVNTSTENLDLDVNIDQFSLAWLQPFLSATLNRLSGSVSAGLNVKGSTKAPITNGWLGLNDATFGIDYTNVAYHITDTIQVSPDRIGFDYLILRDDLGNYGLASATLTHKNFENMQYKLDMHLYNLMVLNTESRTDSMFYGKVFASGDVNIIGNDDKINIDMKVTNSRNSNISVLLPQSSTASEYESIVYINTPDSAKVSKPKEVPLPLNISVGLAIDPRINLRVVIDPLTGDEMQVTGNGHIDFSYDLQADRMSTLGEYVLKDGLVKYKIPQLLKTLDFQVQEGSKLIFKGDPLQTEFNITAFKRVRDVDLKTLDASFASTMSSTKVNADCILKISGNMNKMDLSYSVGLPDVPDDVKRRAESVMSTEEQQIIQFAYLVGFGSFYSSSGSNADIADGLVTSLASGLASKTLNAIFGNILGNKWHIGTNISTSDSNFNDVDVRVNVSRNFLDDKLKFNTNLGYRSQQSNVSDNPFIGDFDVEYALTQNWSIKAYNHTNDQYYKQGQAEMTQGVGVSYTKEAKTLRGLLSFFKKNKSKKDKK
ncbi:translocation/assembly module TamB domain-containing protein [Dysgonomonas sp. 520]|uniref:translocation/assembly module TamB domain-containing protein n=1 Tax=Dysgonomonas sp. 520 TaxID=2302931 RepID=UPI0013CFD097|nr:translocation/assembly module TamB domain-containing protein [Dysgonomonas sp. 520]NDW10415.1 DUF748 domain-containing protein [Dysgonomonas sp. 520]